jgi:hypothetical protein
MTIAMTVTQRIRNTAHATANEGRLCVRARGRAGSFAESESANGEVPRGAGSSRTQSDAVSLKDVCCSTSACLFGTENCESDDQGCENA